MSILAKATDIKFIGEKKGYIASIYNMQDEKICDVPMIGLPKMDEPPKLLWGILIGDFTSSVSPTGISVGLFIPIQMLPENTTADLVYDFSDNIETSRKIHSNNQKYYYLFETTKNLLKYNEDTIIIGNDENYLMVTDEGIVLKGKMINENNEEMSFLRDNKLGKAFPVVIDPSGTLFPYYPTLPKTLTKIGDSLMFAVSLIGSLL